MTANVILMIINKDIYLLVGQGETWFSVKRVATLFSTWREEKGVNKKIIIIKKYSENLKRETGCESKESSSRGQRTFRNAEIFALFS